MDPLESLPRPKDECHHRLAIALAILTGRIRDWLQLTDHQCKILGFKHQDCISFAENQENLFRLVEEIVFKAITLEKDYLPYV